MSDLFSDIDIETPVINGDVYMDKLYKKRDAIMEFIKTTYNNCIVDNAANIASDHIYITEVDANDDRDVYYLYNSDVAAYHMSVKFHDGDSKIKSIFIDEKYNFNIHNTGYRVKYSIFPILSELYRRYNVKCDEICYKLPEYKNTIVIDSMLDDIMLHPEFLNNLPNISVVGYCNASMKRDVFLYVTDCKFISIDNVKKILSKYNYKFKFVVIDTTSNKICNNIICAYNDNRLYHHSVSYSKYVKNFDLKM